MPGVTHRALPMWSTCHPLVNGLPKLIPTDILKTRTLQNKEGKWLSQELSKIYHKAMVENQSPWLTQCATSEGTPVLRHLPLLYAWKPVVRHIALWEAPPKSINPLCKVLCCRREMRPLIPSLATLSFVLPPASSSLGVTPQQIIFFLFLSRHDIIKIRPCT